MVLQREGDGFHIGRIELLIMEISSGDEENEGETRSGTGGTRRMYHGKVTFSDSRGSDIGEELTVRDGCGGRESVFMIGDYGIERAG